MPSNHITLFFTFRMYQIQLEPALPFLTLYQGRPKLKEDVRIELYLVLHRSVQESEK